MALSPLLSEFHIQKNKDWNLKKIKIGKTKQHVWIPYPEKQGLKLLYKWLSKIPTKVWIPYPEKQGLKLLIIPDLGMLQQRLNSISRKTRIETDIKLIFYFHQILSEFHIQKNKDWNNPISYHSASRKTRIETKKQGAIREESDLSEFHIQKNKDWNYRPGLI